jgi:hypothetical protein
LLLPFKYTQGFEMANWGYLNAYLATWAVVLSLAMGVVLSVQTSILKVVLIYCVRLWKHFDG